MHTFYSSLFLFFLNEWVIFFNALITKIIIPIVIKIDIAKIIKRIILSDIKFESKFETYELIKSHPSIIQLYLFRIYPFIILTYLDHPYMDVMLLES